MKKKNFISLLLSLTLVSAPLTNFVHNNISFAEEEYVNVPDYNMKRGLLMALASVNGTGKYDFSETEIRNAKFKKSELEKIKKINPELCVAHTCTEEGVKIIDLTGIEYCINLEDLSLVNQRVTNLNPIKNLTKLKKLELRNNSNKGKAIEDISAISNLKDLEYLNLAQAKIKDTAPLSNLTKLKHLDLLGTKIDTLDFAKNLTNLTYLDASLNYINNISPLENCVNLKTLKLSQNLAQANEQAKEKISDISTLSHLTSLEELYMDNHNVKDISPLKNLKALTNLTLLNNKIENFEPTFVIPNLIELWTSGNKTGLENKIDNYKKAKEFFNILNKQTLTKEDIKTIEELENSNDTIKNYFSDETLNKLSSAKEDLKTKDLNLDLFGYLNLNGEIISIAKLKGYKGSIGNDFLGRLPKNVEITIKKSNSNENTNGEITSGIVQLDEKENYILKVAVVDKNNKLIKEKVDFISSKDNKIYSSENGYLTIDKTMANTVQWLETVFSLQSEKYTANKTIKVTKTTPTKLGIYDGNTYVDQKSEMEKLLVVKLSEKNSSIDPEDPTPIIPPTPDDTKKDENIGVKEKRVYFKVIDKNKKLVTSDVNLIAKDSENFTNPITAKQDGNYYYFEYKNEDYTWNINFSSEKYNLKDGESHSFTTAYPNGFSHIGLNGVRLTVDKIEQKDAEKRDEYYTINVISNNETTDTPEPSIPEISDSKKDENIGVKENKLYFRIVDENKKLVTDEISIVANDTENFSSPLKAKQDGNYYYFDAPAEDYSWNIKFISDKYNLNNNETHSFTTSYSKGFTHIGLNHINLSLDKIEEKEISERNAYYTINVKSNNLRSAISPLSILSSAYTLENVTVEEKTDTNKNVENTESTENLIKTVVGIKWNVENFKNEVGTYDLTGDLILPDGVSNPKNLKAKIRIIVKEKKIIAPSEEALGELLTNDNKQILKVVIANEEKNIITDPIVVTDGIYSYISKDGYVEIPVLNGNHEIKLADDKYIEVEDRYKESKTITYSGYFNRLININNNLLNEISSLGLKRQLRLIVKENKVDPEKPVDPINPEKPIDPVNPEKPVNPGKPIESDKTGIIFTEDKSSKIEGKELKNIDSKNLKLIVKEEKHSNISKDLKLFEGKDINIFDIYLQNTKTKEKFELPKGDYKVTLPKTKNNDVISVNYIDKNGNLEKHNFTQTENTVTFETTHLSLYAIEYKVVNENHSNGNSNNTKNNTTVDNSKNTTINSDNAKNNSVISENNNNDDYTTNTNNTSSNTNLSSKQKLVKTNIASTSQFVTVLLGLGVVVISKKKKFK